MSVDELVSCNEQRNAVINDIMLGNLDNAAASTINHSLSDNMYFELIDADQKITKKNKYEYFCKLHAMGIDNAVIYHHLAMHLIQQGNKNAAKKYLEYNIENHPDYIPSCLEYASCLKELGHMDKAIGLLLALYEAGCHDIELIASLSISYMFLKKSKYADFFLKKIKDKDELVLLKSLLNLANHFSMSFMFDDAERVYLELERAYPSCYDIYNAHARMLLSSENNLALARQYLVVSIRKSKHLKHTYHDLGFLYIKTGKFKKAMSYLDRNFKANADNTDVIWAYMTILLLRGELRKGWQFIDIRLFKGWSNFLIECVNTINSVDEIHGNVLLVNEQGVGDQIMFLSFVIDLLKLNLNITVLVEPRLIELFSRSFPTVKFESSMDYNDILKNKRFDKIYFIATLAKFLRTDFSSFPHHNGYLLASKDKIEYYRKSHIASGKKLKIGISWQSMSINGAKCRNIPLSNWSFINSYSDILFVNIQFGHFISDVIDFNHTATNPIYTPSDIDFTNDLDDVAALICSCDLIITIDNTIAHLSGALNVPVLCLLPIGCDFRWFLDKEDSPWYPSMRLIRQSQYNDWTSVMNQVNKQLQALVHKA